MRSSTEPTRPEPSQPLRGRRVVAGAAIICALAAACTGTEGDLLRSIADAQTGGDSVMPPLRTWQIQLSGTLDTTFDVQLYTVDLDTDVAAIRDLSTAGRTVICYFSAGTMEPFRRDAAQFPANALGAPVAGYPDEQWVDVRNDTVRSIMQARLSRAAGAGCGGIHPSGLAAFQTTTGFDFTRADQLAYNRWLASVGHGLGLSMGLVDGDMTFSQDLLPDFDWMVVWSCLASGCGLASPFVNAGKEAFLVEIGDASRVSEVCPSAKTLGLSAILKNRVLDAFRVGCP